MSKPSWFWIAILVVALSIIALGIWDGNEEGAARHFLRNLLRALL